jgi:hypothetical protein
MKRSSSSSSSLSRPSKKNKQAYPPHLHPLILTLTCVRLVLHQFLSGDDVNLLLRVSRTFARNILPGFSFNSIVFEIHHSDELWRFKRLYEGVYHLRIRHLVIHESVTSLDLQQGVSPFPSSLTTVQFGMCLDCNAYPLPGYENVDGHIWMSPKRHFYSDVCKCVLPIGLLPFGVKSVSFLAPYLRVLIPGVFPSSVTSLWLGKTFNQPLPVGLLPSFVQDLDLQFFNKPLLPGVLPRFLQKLSLYSFNHPLEVGVFPPYLKKLSLYAFNHPLEAGVLPPCLRDIMLVSFKQPLPRGVLPNSLTDLDLSSFNQQQLIEGDLPPGLVRIHLDAYNMPLSLGVFPTSLKELQMMGFRQTLEIGVLPDSLEDLSVGAVLIKPGALPCKLEKLFFEFFHPISPNTFPEELGEITLFYWNWRGVDNPPVVVQGGKIELPSNLQYLKLCGIPMEWDNLFDLPPGCELIRLDD